METGRHGEQGEKSVEVESQEPVYRWGKHRTYPDAPAMSPGMACNSEISPLK